MFQTEEAHWWYLGLRDLIVPAVLGGLIGRDRTTVLDAGCGTGRNLAALASVNAVGLEFSKEAFRFLRRRGLNALARGSVDRLPFRDQSFDVVLSADVLCCVGPPGDLAALREFRRVLKPGGRLILNLPAYDWLRGRHDEAVHTRKRYTQAGLVGLLSQAGFVIQICSYRNTFLFPIVAAVRLGQRLRGDGGGSGSDLSIPPVAVNRLLSLPLLVENRLIRWGVRFPFGLSVHVVAEPS